MWTLYRPLLDNWIPFPSQQNTWLGGKEINSLFIPKHLYLGYLVDWARELGCAHDELLIANCLDFIDAKAQAL